MQFSERWLRQFVDPSLNSEALAHALTMAGLEVESVEAAAPPFRGVVVAEVLAVDRHPEAGRLSVCRVDVGGEALQIVCGAPNVRAGTRAPCARVGAELPGLRIGKAKVRGIESFGMLCSARELGLADESEGLLALPADAPVGADLREFLDLDDRVFALKLTPNRGDCLSVAGVAREVAAVAAASLRLPDDKPVAAQVDDVLPVRVDASEACPLYCGRVIRGVNAAAPTPEWMVRRLARSGVRSLSAVVDITNYVMLEMGQPLHAFDLGRISGGIVVRLARDGESLMLLNEQRAELKPDILIIADHEQPVALAGIMGGADSAVSDGTRDLFLEAAFFTPSAIQGKSFALGFSSESAHRFERGVDFAATRTAMERATRLVLEICGGSPGPVTQVASTLPKRDPIQLRVERVRRVLGIDLDAAGVSALLRRLQFRFVDERGVFYVTPHSYRFDLSIEEDLIEEVARLHGYERIPATLPAGGMRMLAAPEAERGDDVLRRNLVARDYQEAVTYSFVDEEIERDLAANGAPLRLVNPIASQMAVMRSTLMGGLLQVLRHNLARRQPRVRLFEMGRCFVSHGADLHQPEHLGGVACGPLADEQWGLKTRGVDFFDVKGDLEALCAPRRLETRPAGHPALHPGRSARVLIDGAPVGWLGELHPQWQRKYDLPLIPVLFELELTGLRRGRVPAFGEVSRFPPVFRDLAVLADESVAAQDMLDALQHSGQRLVADVSLFDVYRGPGLPDGKKSLAFRVLLQDTEKTLTDSDVATVMDAMVRVLAEKFQADLRS